MGTPWKNRFFFYRVGKQAALYANPFRERAKLSAKIPLRVTGRDNHNGGKCA